VVRGDHGTENGLVATAQLAFRHMHVDDLGQQPPYRSIVSNGAPVTLIEKGLGGPQCMAASKHFIMHSSDYGKGN